MHGSFLIYGANGYTGELVVEEACRRGLKPIVAGRNKEAITRLGQRLNLQSRVVGLEEDALVPVLKDVGLVLNCAGPFSHTFRPMLLACLRAGKPYLDINGELEVFEDLRTHDEQARHARVMLLPGVGCDVVPTDCLALHLKLRLPGARRLVLGFAMTAGPSQGTAAAMLEMGVSTGHGMVRQNGTLVPSSRQTREFDFGTGSPHKAISVPWGDLCTAFHSTGIPNIEVYGVYPTALQAILQNVIKSGIRGPTPEELESGASYFVGEAEDEAGHKVRSRLIGPNAYTLTARSAVLAVEQVLQGRIRPGFQTPSRLFGAEFVLGVPGVSLVDLP
jgi:short subunit dehydrogenase-like uncharacterized protein